MNLATAIALAANRHRSQVDKGGRPYIRRLKGIGAKDVERMKKYHAAYLTLRGLDKAEDRH